MVKGRLTEYGRRMCGTTFLEVMEIMADLINEPNGLGGFTQSDRITHPCRGKVGSTRIEGLFEESSDTDTLVPPEMDEGSANLEERVRRLIGKVMPVRGMIFGYRLMWVSWCQLRVTQTAD